MPTLQIEYRIFAYVVNNYDNTFTVISQWRYALKILPSCNNSHCSAAVSSAYGGRQTMGVTAVVRAADGRRTISKT